MKFLECKKYFRKIKKSKKIFSAGILFSLGFFAVAQVSVNPNDEFYKLAQGWEDRNLLSDALPLLRPYPINSIKAILKDVIVNGNESERAEAQIQWNRVFGKKCEFYLNGGFDFRHSAEQEDSARGIEADSKNTKNLQGEIGVRGDVILHSLVGIGYNIAFYGESADFEDWNPYKTLKYQDSVFDAVSVSKFDIYNNWNTNVQFGKPNLFATAGVSRIGFGPFIGEGLALNDMSYHSANIVFSATRKKWSYSSVFEVIGATNNFPQDDLTSGKFLAFHALKYRITPKASVTYYENLVWGPKFNPLYLVPSPYMAIQNIGGANENLQMGLLFELKPTKGLNWATDIFVDDFGIEEILKLNFDTKIRVGGQTGFIFSPEKSKLSRLCANYQIVLPYVYAHWEYESSSSGSIQGTTVNYQNYLNNGISIGSSLDPNSDKVSFSANFKPIERLSIDFNTAFIRHANSAEAFDDDDAAEYILAKSNQYITDGSANMHQMFSDEEGTSGNHVNQAWDKLGFMTSDHKMYVCQAGLSAKYDFPRTSKGQFSLILGYTFEYIRNAGVDSNIFTGGKINWSKNADNTYTANDKTYNSWDELKASDEVRTEIKNQKEAWANALRDQVNHYISVGFKYAY